ncbi:uncharacterized protein RHO25_004795 [Cercospora beticola]|uniref:Uncharacterized protein n=1 Tax=Cercospora beticola TaxID=122368 RepID=A0ABZ0NKZ0_CERBT|nr:hypothetical protein RHO25_004795 [Cercospora beticola]CAK1361634.1 unnamed protein product [Cercospora beticola]
MALYASAVWREMDMEDEQNVPLINKQRTRRRSQSIDTGYVSEDLGSRSSLAGSSSSSSTSRESSFDLPRREKKVQLALPGLLDFIQNCKERQLLPSMSAAIASSPGDGVIKTPMTTNSKTTVFITIDETGEKIAKLSQMVDAAFIVGANELELCML